MQLKANLGWCFAANNAICDPTSAVEIKLYRKLKNGKREEIIEHELLDLLNAPNAAHTGEQLRHLHFTPEAAKKPAPELKVDPLTLFLNFPG